MRIRLVASIVGMMIVICGIGMAIPAIVDFMANERTAAMRFALSAGMTVSIGLVVRLLAGSGREPLRIKEMFLCTTLIWLFFSLFSALPFFVSIYHISWTDSVFESMSGLTTTGATVLSDLDHMSRGLLLWRSMLQWFGGLGIIIVAILVFPILRIGGMHFFNTESSAQSERDLPTVVKNMRAISIYFIGLSAVCALSLWLAGMGKFDAVCHAMTTIATGGFSTHDASIAYFNNPVIEWILIFFMFVSGLPLILGFLIWKKQWRSIRNNIQIGSYIRFVAIVISVLTCIRFWVSNESMNSIGRLLRESAFSVVSVVTTTGFVSVNYQTWGAFSVALFVFLLACGSCTGSTSGGIKIFRFSILNQTIGIRMRNLVQPHGVFVARYGERPIADDVLISVLVFLGFFAGTVIVTTLALSLTGLDLITAFSGAMSGIANVGPGLGEMIGPDDTFAALPNAAKWILIVAMMVGRLEFATVFVLFFPFLWRRNA
jgi:trk system potassium uptake protein TrkH